MLAELLITHLNAMCNTELDTSISLKADKTFVYIRTPDQTNTLALICLSATELSVTSRYLSKTNIILYADEQFLKKLAKIIRLMKSCSKNC